MAFITHLSIGSFCMMPMAMAATSPSHDMDATDQVMTPMAPMSHADCPDCPHHQEKQEPVQQSSCAGHCLSNAQNANLANVVIAANQLVVAFPAKAPVILSNEQETFFEPSITASPPPITTSTVVLTL